MINIVLVENNLNYCQKILNEISLKNKNLKVCAIINSIYEIELIIIDNPCIDFIVIDYRLYDNLQLSKINFPNYITTILLYNKNNMPKIVKNDLSIIKYTSTFKNLEKTLLQIINSQKTSIKTQNENRIKNQIRKELDFLGYNPLYIGTTYLLETIYILYLLKDFSIDNLSQKIYPIISKKYGKTTNTIKCNIRNATEFMYYDCDENILKTYLGINFSKNPGSKKIINAILNKII